MTRDIRDVYRLSRLEISEVNRLLARMSDRIDELEGRRGTPGFYANLDLQGNRATNATAAVDAGDYVLSSEVVPRDGGGLNLRLGTVYGSAVEAGSLTATTARLGTGTDYTGVDSTGMLTFNGAATVWDDSMVPATAARTAAADLALQTLSGGIYAPRVDLNDEIYSVVQFPHSLKTSGTVTIKPHIHLINQNAIGASNYNVSFDIEWLWGNIGSTLAGTSQSDKRCSFQNALALTHKMLVFDDITASAGQGGISSLFFCRVKRVAAGADAYNTNDIFWGGLDIHFEKDTVGSREPSSK